MVWVGRCAPEKRLREFVESCKAAIDALPSGSLAVEVIGDGPELAAARDAAHDYPDITFRGALDPESAQSRIEHAHLLAISSDGFDNQPMVIVEALRHARGVLFADPNLAEGLGNAGYQARSSEKAAFADGLIHLAHSPELVEEMSREAANAYSTTFGPDVVTTKLLTAYAHAERIRDRGRSTP